MGGGMSVPHTARLHRWAIAAIYIMKKSWGADDANVIQVQTNLVETLRYS